jgi:hypothetical protein
LPVNLANVNRTLEFKENFEGCSDNKNIPRHDLLNCGQFEKYEFNANAGFGWAESGSPRKPNS